MPHDDFRRIATMPGTSQGAPEDEAGRSAEDYLGAEPGGKVGHRLSTFRIIHADVLDGLRSLPDASVHCCVTSPPYWGLRDYGTAKWEGGDAACDHKGGRDQSAASTVSGGAPYLGSEGIQRGTCGKCGATRVDQQLGLERTPEEYVAAMVAVFREVRRVLRADGTCWINLGDSYAAGGNGRRDMASLPRPKGGHVTDPGYYSQRAVPLGLKPKDLVGIPWRVAFALQADGWYLRSDIIWHKPNPMPESVTDRPTKAHEYLFLLTKSERYAYDAAAIAEPCIRPGDVQTFGGQKATNGTIPEGDPRFRNGHEQWGRTIQSTETRNKRSVWTINSEPYAKAHFAVMPTQLVEPCVMAGCPEGGTVLDPFAGSGTVGVVACRHARDFIGIELNAEYVEMARRRIQDDMPMFNVEAESWVALA